MYGEKSLPDSADPYKSSLHRSDLPRACWFLEFNIFKIFYRHSLNPLEFLLVLATKQNRKKKSKTNKN